MALRERRSPDNSPLGRPTVAAPAGVNRCRWPGFGGGRAGTFFAILLAVHLLSGRRSALFHQTHAFGASVFLRGEPRTCRASKDGRARSARVTGWRLGLQRGCTLRLPGGTRRAKPPWPWPPPGLDLTHDYATASLAGPVEHVDGPERSCHAGAATLFAWMVRQSGRCANLLPAAGQPGDGGAGDASDALAGGRQSCAPA